MLYNLSKKEQEIIREYLAIFNTHFKEVEIERVDNTFYIFQSEPNFLERNWFWHTTSPKRSEAIYELNGFLYGTVKLLFKQIKLKEDKTDGK